MPVTASFEKEEYGYSDEIYLGVWEFFYQVWKNPGNKPLVRSDTNTETEPFIDK